MDVGRRRLSRFALRIGVSDDAIKSKNIVSAGEILDVDFGKVHAMTRARIRFGISLGKSMGLSYRYLEPRANCVTSQSPLGNVKLFELFSGLPPIFMGSPAIGAKKWALRQIIKICGAVPDTLLTQSGNLGALRDEDGTPPRRSN